MLERTSKYYIPNCPKILHHLMQQNGALTIFGELANLTVLLNIVIYHKLLHIRLDNDGRKGRIAGLRTHQICNGFQGQAV
jgi:hypothetical protein